MRTGLQLMACLGALAAGASVDRVLGAALRAENLLFSPPGEFKVGYQSSRDDRSLTEFVPVGESVQDWSEMVTVQVLRHAKVESQDFLQDVGARFMTACPGTVSLGIVTGRTNGYGVSMLVLKCPQNLQTGKPETTAFRVIKGVDALYSVQHAWRSVPGDRELADVMRALGRVTVCDTRTPEHPCPSLDSVGNPN